jgi:Ca2+-binding EF-hand superfamily protein
MFRGLDQIASSQDIEAKIENIVVDADRDKSGTLDLDEFIAWYDSVYMVKLDREARRLFKRLDKDGSGSLDREELKDFIQEVSLADTLLYCALDGKTSSGMFMLSASC